MELKISAPYLSLVHQISRKVCANIQHTSKQDGQTQQDKFAQQSRNKAYRFSHFVTRFPPGYPRVSLSMLSDRPAHLPAQRQQPPGYLVFLLPVIQGPCAYFTRKVYRISINTASEVSQFVGEKAKIAGFQGGQLARRRSAREEKFGGGQTPRPPFHQLPPGRNGVFFAGWWEVVGAWWAKKNGLVRLNLPHPSAFHHKIGAKLHVGSSSK
jgi:hypothetical protein